MEIIGDPSSPFHVSVPIAETPKKLRSSHPAAGEISIHHRGQALQVAAESRGSQKREDAGGCNHGTLRNHGADLRIPAMI